MRILTKDTTREEREKIVRDGIALSMTDSLPPTDVGMTCFNKYIEGEMELSEIVTAILASYKETHT